MAGFARGPPRSLKFRVHDHRKEMKVGFDYDDGGPWVPEEIDYAEELRRGDWLPAYSIWDGWSTRPYAPIPDLDPIAVLLREKAGIWHPGRSQDFWHYYDATPYVTSVAEVFDLLGTGKTEEQRRAEGLPTTVKETDLRLRQVTTALQAEPSLFWDPGYSEWCADSRMGSASSPHRYKEAYLHGEVWRNGDTLQEIHVFYALRPWDRLEPPRKTIERLVHHHVCFLNRDPEPIVDEDEDDDFLL